MQKVNQFFLCIIIFIIICLQLVVVIEQLVSPDLVSPFNIVLVYTLYIAYYSRKFYQ